MAEELTFGINWNIWVFAMKYSVQEKSIESAAEPENIAGKMETSAAHL